MSSANKGDKSRKERFDEVCYCGKKPIRCTHCWTCVFGSLCLCFTALTIFSVVFSNILGFCRTDETCPDSECQRGVCSTICRLEPIPGCCKHASDCPSSPCQEQVCSDNTCMSFPLSNIPCDDGSECTIHDQCEVGVCRGEPTTRHCYECVKNVFIKAVDGTPCDDADTCTQEDSCQQGVCQGVARQCPNKACNVGVCQPDVGCIFEPTDEVSQPDLCTNGICEDGVYREVHKDCFDGNPCTLDACYPMTGLCVNPPAEAGGCNVTCTQDSDCHAIGSGAQYACWDGNCADVTAGEMIIRLSHAEIDFDGCAADHARLQMRFFMDSEVVNSLYHIPLTESITGIYPHLQAFDVMSEHRGMGIRTYFSMRTDCQDLSVDCYPFINREYEFVVKRYPCHALSGAHCAMEPDPTYVMLPLSVVNCPYDIARSIELLPTLAVQQRGWEINASIALENLSPWITDVSLCVPKDIPLAACIENEDIEHCPYRGCENTPMQYLDEKIRFVSDSNYTSAMTTYSSSYNVRMALGYANYDGDKCASDHNVDWFSFNVLALRGRYEGRTVVLDIGYTAPTCSGRRLNSVQRTIATIKI